MKNTFLRVFLWCCCPILLLVSIGFKGWSVNPEAQPVSADLLVMLVVQFGLEIWKSLVLFTGKKDDKKSGEETVCTIIYIKKMVGLFLSRLPS